METLKGAFIVELERKDRLAWLLCERFLPQGIRGPWP